MTCKRSRHRSAATPSICPGSVDSIVSLSSLPSTPPVWSPRASVPAKGPSPTAVTNMRANTNSLTARRTSMSRRATRVDRRVRGAVARAQEAERDGDHDGENRAPEGDAERHDALPGVLAEVRRRTGARSRCRKTAMFLASRRSSKGRSSTTRAARPSATTRSEPGQRGSAPARGGVGRRGRGRTAEQGREGVGHGSAHAGSPLGSSARRSGSVRARPRRCRGARPG